MEQTERYRGAMLGLAVGDALGCPVEGLKAGHIQQLYGRVEGYVDPGAAWKKKPHRWRMPGLYSDDTQQALLLADSMIRCRGFNPKHFTDLLIDMAKAETGGRFGAYRGTGKNFRSSVRTLMDGAHPAESGLPSAGIGAIMRVAPVGLYFVGDDEALMRAAVEQGLVTHRDPRSLVMAVLVALAVSRSVARVWDGTQPEDRLKDVLHAAGEAERLVEKDYIHHIPVVCLDRLGMAESGVKILPGLLELPDPKMAMKQIIGEANRQFPEHKITEPGQGFVMAAGLTSLYFALTARNFEDAVINAVNLGKDTDTMGAIVGAISGARFGEEAIPEKWLTDLINAEQVGLRGEALLEKSMDGMAIKNVVSMEAELTMREQEARMTFIERQEQKGVQKLPVKKEKSEPPPALPSPRDRRGKRQKPKREKAPWKK